MSARRIRSRAGAGLVLAALVATGCGSSASDREPRLLFNAFVGDDQKAAYLVRPDGTSMRQILTDLGGDVRAVSWSPEGTAIVFAFRDAADSDTSIWTATADGTGATMFYDGREDGCGAVHYPAWSPDGSRLAFVCYQDNAALLRILDVGTHRVTTLATTHWPDWLDNPPAWSPDGATLAYDVLHWDPTNSFIDGSRIAVVPADGSRKPRELGPLGSFASYPDWSPDGSRLLYNTRDLGNGPDDGPSNLFTMKVDGSDVRQLTTASTDAQMRIGHPRWDPDGSRIWVTVLRGGDVTLGWVDAATGALKELAVNGSRPEPRPVP